jgi:D-xylose transport system substrate-binding protein
MIHRTVMAALLAAVVAACNGATQPEIALLLIERDGAGAELRAFRTAAGSGVATFVARDHAAQTAQVERALAAGAKVLVIEPADATASAAFVQRAHERGALVAAYAYPIASEFLDGYVAHDDYLTGVLQAEAGLDAAGRRGQFVLLAGPRDHVVASEIALGYEHTLAPYVARGDVRTLLRRHDHPGEVARTLAEAHAGAPIAAVLATSSELAGQAIAELERTGHRTGVFVAGADGTSAGLHRVCAGQQSLAIVRDGAALARTAAETARQLLDGGELARGRATAESRGRAMPDARVRVEVVTAAACS